MSEDYQDYSDFSEENNEIETLESSNDDTEIENNNEQQASDIEEQTNESETEVDVELIDGIANVEQLNTVEKKAPILTRPVCYAYELAAVITDLAVYLESLSDIQAYIEATDDILLPNTAEFAFRLLENGSFDAIIDRGIEKVSYSLLEKNPQDIERLNLEFEDQRNVLKKVIKQWEK